MTAEELHKHSERLLPWALASFMLLGLGGTAFYQIYKKSHPAPIEQKTEQTAQKKKNSVIKTADYLPPLPENCKALYVIIGHKGEYTDGNQTGGVQDGCKGILERLFSGIFSSEKTEPIREVDLNNGVAKNLLKLIKIYSPNTKVYLDVSSGETLTKTRKLKRINKNLEDLANSYSTDEIAVIHLHMDDNCDLKDKPAAVGIYSGRNSKKFGPFFDDKKFIERAEYFGNSILEELDKTGIKSRWIPVKEGNSVVKKRVFSSKGYADESNLTMLDEIPKKYLNVLIEMGNIETPNDANFLKDNPNLAARAIYKGLINYYFGSNNN